MPTATQSAAPAWDAFIVHAHQDANAAKALFDRLGPGYKVFLDREALQGASAWDQVIPAALRSSRLMVVLVSPEITEAHYARDEIIRGIALARSNPGRYGVVPVYLHGRPSQEDIPYGLAPFQSLDPRTDGGLDGIAQRLRGMVDRLRDGRPVAPPPEPPPRVSLPVDDLQRYPRWPHVEPEQIELCLLKAYAEAINPKLASEVVARANAARRRADPSDTTVTTISPADVAPPLSVPPIEYWHDVFREARLHGPRMLAALLLAVDPTQFPDDARRARGDLLEYLASL